MVDVGKKRKIRCGSCAGCLAQDCRKCRFCIDMKKYGGQRRLKEACLDRKCKNGDTPLASVPEHVNDENREGIFLVCVGFG